jgi:hypothetical protein
MGIVAAGYTSCGWSVRNIGRQNLSRSQTSMGATAAAAATTATTTKHSTHWRVIYQKLYYIVIVNTETHVP